jgi:hypothetical protein
VVRSASLFSTFCLLGQFLVAGEVSYQETTKITGGSLTSMMKFAGVFSKDARKLDQPVVTTVAVKGNRMVRVTPDSAEITDLDAQTITHIDKIKRQYSVVTFAQMREAFERAMEKAKAEQANAGSQSVAAPQPAKDPNMQLDFQAHVRKTGAARQVSGLDTNEIILTVVLNQTDKTTGQQGAFALTNDMWMAPDIPAYAEIRDFERRFAQELGSTYGSGRTRSGPDLFGLVQQAQSSEALKAMAKEMGNLQGVPVLQVMRMGMTTNGQPLPAASEAPLPSSNRGSGQGDAVGGQIAKASENTAQQTAAQEASEKIRGALGSSLGSAIGGFGGFGHKKKQTAASDSTASNGSSSQSGAAAQPPTAAVLIESASEIGNFSQQVDPALFEIPPGFLLIASPELKQP